MSSPATRGSGDGDRGGRRQKVRKPHETNEAVEVCYITTPNDMGSLSFWSKNLDPKDFFCDQGHVMDAF